MDKYNDLEKEVEKKLKTRDKKKKPKMKVSGKSVFSLQKLINKPNDRVSKRKNHKKNYYHSICNLLVSGAHGTGFCGSIF